jgi:flagellin
MAMTINTNIAALNAQRNLGKTQSMLNKSLQRLSSGLRINSAKDDAAGLAIGTRMGAQVRGLNQAIRNANDGISLAQTAEGALQETTNLLQRIRELAVQSANDTNTASDRASMQAEVSQLLQELGRVAETTQFNGKSLLDGTFTSAQFQVGANANQTISMGVNSAKTSDLGSYQANGAVAVTTDALIGGDLSINGTDVGASTNGSAESKAIAINAVSDTTGVTASAATSVSSDQTLLRNQSLESGDLTINGVNVGAVSGSNTIAIQGSNLATAINAVTNQTGVIASSDLSTGALTLTSSTGKNVVIGSNNGNEGFNRLENATGFAVSDSAAQSTNIIEFTLGTKAVNSFTASGVGVEGQTLSIGGHVFIYVASGEGNSATEIDIGSDTASHIANVKTAFDLANLSNVTIGDVTGGDTVAVTSDVVTSTTNKDRLCERSEPRSYPVVGQARCICIFCI